MRTILLKFPSKGRQLPATGGRGTGGLGREHSRGGLGREVQRGARGLEVPLHHGNEALPLLRVLLPTVSELSIACSFFIIFYFYGNFEPS